MYLNKKRNTIITLYINPVLENIYFNWDCKEKMKGGIGCNLRISGVDR